MSGPEPIVSVEIRSLPTGTLWMRSSGGRPLGSRNRPSKPTARSRSPRAYRRRWLRTPRRRTARPRAAGARSRRRFRSRRRACGGSRRPARGRRSRYSGPPSSGRCRRGGCGTWRRSLAPRRGSGTGASGTPPRRGPKGRTSRATYPRARWVRSGPCLTSRSTTPEPAPCSRSAARSVAGGDLRLRADGLRARARRQRAAVRRLLAAQAVPGARGLRRRAGRQRHRHQRQDLRRGAGRGAAVGGAGGRDGAPLHRRYRPARARAAGRRAVRDRVRRARSSS